MVDDIVKLLQRWDVWKRVEAAPGRIDALEKRIAELEARLTGKPGQACPSCGELSLRVEKSEISKTPLGRLGARDMHYRCKACDFTEVRLAD